MNLNADTKILALIDAYPFLEDFLVDYHPRFAMLKNKVARATVGRFATVGAAAKIAAIEVTDLLSAVAEAIAKETALRPTETGPKARPTTREERIALLTQIIADLHQGGNLETARQKFADAVGDVAVDEIAAMEEAMIKGGLPVGEVQRLCDVHVGAFRNALDGKPALHPTPGHPVHTYLADNQHIARLATRLVELGREATITPDWLGLWDAYRGLDNHYQRKEHQLFPLLERHGITGPTQVMWGVHDGIRGQWKALRSSVEAHALARLADQTASLARAMTEMIYKEEKILLPLAMETLTEQEWIEEKRGEDELGYVFVQPAALAPPEPNAPHGDPPKRLPLFVASAHPKAPVQGDLPLSTGSLSLEVINLLFKHLPLDLSFVDENDVVRYYSECSERIFPRTPAAIGRTVQNCHPPKSVHIVNRILGAFRAGEKDVAEFWLTLGGRFIHIRYLAVRDDQGQYRGCLEVAQDVTHIRALQGDRRLLDWEN